MLLYKIQYKYQTGDSFKTYDDEGMLEMVWKNLDNAKTALQRIKEHYAWYQYENRQSWSDAKEVSEPDWHKGEKYQFTLKVMLDNGKEIKFSAPWCGYFERLHSAEIIADDPDLRIEF